MIERITELWKQGLSMTEIANDLGTNKNVIAGHVYRARKSGIVLDARPKKPKKIAVSLGSKKSRGIDHPVIHLTRNNCRFILNEDTSNPKYCCEPVKAKSYCSHHLRQCYYPATPRGGKARRWTNF